MRIFSRNISNWWHLSVVPFIVVLAPLLMMLFFLGNDFAGTIIGPPAIWDRPFHTPTLDDLVGKYSESERHLDRAIGADRANLKLDADGSMSVANLPYQFAEASCLVSGRGWWQITNKSGDLWLKVISDGSAGA